MGVVVIAIQSGYFIHIIVQHEALGIEEVNMKIYPYWYYLWYRPDVLISEHIRLDIDWWIM